jgi:hypothetical protein
VLANLQTVRDQTLANGHVGSETPGQDSSVGMIRPDHEHVARVMRTMPSEDSEDDDSDFEDTKSGRRNKGSKGRSSTANKPANKQGPKGQPFPFVRSQRATLACAGVVSPSVGPGRNVSRAETLLRDEQDVLQKIAHMKSLQSMPALENQTPMPAIQIEPGDRFFDELHGWAAVEDVLQQLAVVHCDGAHLISKAGRTTRRGVTYRFRCGFANQGCKWLVEVDILTAENSHTDFHPQVQPKKDRALHHANHVCNLRIESRPHSNHRVCHSAIVRGPIPLFKARANINPHMLSMTRTDILRWIQAQGIQVPETDVPKILSINKKYGERKRRQKMMDAGGLQADMSQPTVGNLCRVVQDGDTPIANRAQRRENREKTCPSVTPYRTSSPAQHDTSSQPRHKFPTQVPSSHTGVSVDSGFATGHPFLNGASGTAPLGLVVSS